jgi:hypothetical protein
MMAAMMAAGGQVWFGDETTVREFPPLRACWAKQGQQRVVLISGRNGRRVIHGALNAASGDFVSLIPACPSSWSPDNAPPHHPKRVAAAATAAHSQIAWRPFRAPELMPCEDLWRLSKAQIAAHRP